MISRFSFILLLLLPGASYGQTDNIRAREYYNRAMDKVARNDHKGAIVDFSQAIRHDSIFVEAYENRGVARYRLGDFEGAVADYDKALEINPEDFNTLERRGWAKFWSNDFPGAITDFDKAVAGNPEEPGYYLSRGQVRYRLQDYAGAISDFDRVINAWYSSRKSKGEAYFWRGMIMIDTGNTSEGCSDLGRSVKYGYIKAGEVYNAICN